MTVTGNETMQNLKNEALKKIYTLAPASASDPVGFGGHCALTYQEVAQQFPAYCTWVKQMTQEDNTCYRLTRLGNMAPENVPLPTEAEMQEVGYPQSTEAGTKATRMTGAQPGSGSSATSNELMMTSLMARFQQLEEEVTQLRAEKEATRPRKTRADTKTEGSEATDQFSMVSS